MPYVFFHQYFPEIAEKETRTLTTFSHPKLPSGEYGLLEMYCDEVDCDCHRVFLAIASEAHRDILAVIAYGWEDLKFYKNWMKSADPKMLEQLKGPDLNLGSPQSKYAPAFLEVVSQVLKDHNYVERIKRHYRLFRERVQASHPSTVATPTAVQVKVGRNDSCPCGSSKKYKKCCGK